MSLERSQIAQSFKNETIFLTGGTGFVGKLIIEKLLRTCWDLKRIYVLIRPKKGKTPSQRFGELFSYPCFELIKTKNLEEKVRFVEGNCDQPYLGLSPEDLDLLKQKTTCFLHVAASVKFDQTLKEVSGLIKATRTVLEMAAQMEQLKVFLYVSTAYSNCINSHIGEVFYDAPLKPETLLDLVESLDEGALQNLTPILLGEWPNTYVYAKSITEGMIRRSNLGVSRVIVRPSIIGSTLEEPVEGWIDNLYGYIGCALGGSLGLIRSIPFDKGNANHSVPADHVTNCILAAIWKARGEGEDTTTIYNCVGQTILCQEMLDLGRSTYWEFASVKNIWYESLQHRSKFWHAFYVCLYTLLAYFLDAVFFCFGKRPNIAKKCRDLYSAIGALEYFGRREWTFDQDNVTDLRNALSEDDRKLFGFGSEFDWNAYMRKVVLGVRIYLLKDPVETIPEGRRRLAVLFVLHHVTLFFLYYCVYLIGKMIFNWFV